MAIPMLNYPDMAGQAADMYTRGVSLGDAQRRNRLLVDAGQQASRGEMPAAKNTLLAGGDFQQADQLQRSIDTMQDRDLEHASRVQQHLSNIASTIRSPQDFEKAKMVLGRMGLPVDGYTYDMLPTLRAQATTEAERYNRALNERKMRMEEEQARQPKTMEVGGSLVRVDPEGGVSELYRAPPAAKQRYMSTPTGVFDVTTGQYVSDVGGGQQGQGLPPYAEKERQRAIGKSLGEAQANLPMARTNAEYILKNIDELRADPKLGNEEGWLPGMTGWASWLPNISKAAGETRSRIDQIQGQTFLQAFNALRGSGQITDTEGKKATEALNRLSSLGMGYDAYQRALKDFRDEVVNLYNLAQEKAGVRQGGMVGVPSGNNPSSIGLPLQQPNRRPRYNPQTGEIE